MPPSAATTACPVWMPSRGPRMIRTAISSWFATKILEIAIGAAQISMSYSGCPAITASPFSTWNCKPTCWSGSASPPTTCRQIARRCAVSPSTAACIIFLTPQSPQAYLRIRALSDLTVDLADSTVYFGEMID